MLGPRGQKEKKSHCQDMVTLIPKTCQHKFCIVRCLLFGSVEVLSERSTNATLHPVKLIRLAPLLWKGDSAVDLLQTITA